MDLLRLSEVKEDDEDFQSPLDILFDELKQENPNHFAVKQYDIFKFAAGKTAKSILISVGVRLAPFNINQIIDLVSKDTLELELSKEEILFLLKNEIQHYELFDGYELKEVDLDKDVKIDAKYTLDPSEVTKGKYLYDVLVPVTDFYNTETNINTENPDILFADRYLADVSFDMIDLDKTEGWAMLDIEEALAENSENACENVEITNKERQIAFKIGENAYELTLVQKRKPKS